MASQELKAVLRLAGQMDPSLEKAMKKAAKEAGGLEKKGAGIEGAFAKAGAVSAKGIAAITAAATAAAVAVAKIGVDVAKFAIEVGSNFEAGMSQVAATMGKTMDDVDIEHLAQLAKDYGATTSFSATEAAEALNYMALAGYNVEQQTAAMGPILNAAAAGNMELGYASDLVTDSVSALGLEFSELSGFVDEISAASQRANSTMAQMGEAILTVGGTAKGLAGGTTELNTVLGLLADNGIKGAEGGTALRNMILSLSAPTSAAAQQLEQLGIAVADEAGNMRPMQDIMEELNASLEGMGSVERANILSTIFNKRDIKGVEALLGTTTERWNELYGAIENSDGAAEQQAKTLLDNLQGDVKLFQSALEGVGIELYEAMGPALRDIVQSGTAFLDEMRDSGQLDMLAETFGSVAQALAEVAKGVLPDLLNTFGQVFMELADVLVTLMPDLLKMATELLPVLMEVFWEIVPILLNIAKMILPIISQLLTQLAPIIGNLLVQLAPVFEMLALLVISVLEPLMPLIGTLLETLLPPLISIITEILGAIMPFVPLLMEMINAILIPLLPILATLIESLFMPILMILEMIFTQILVPLMPVLILIVQVVMAALSPLLQILGSVLEPMAPVLEVIGTILGFIVGVIAKIIEFVANGIGKVVDFFKGIFGGAQEATQATDELGDSMGALAGESETVGVDIEIAEMPEIPPLEVPAIDMSAATADVANSSGAMALELDTLETSFVEANSTANIESAAMAQSVGTSMQQMATNADASLMQMQAANGAAFSQMKSNVDMFISSIHSAIAALQQLAAQQAATGGLGAGSASVGMAHGGILRATPGGIPVTAAEAGHDEAFIPITRTPRSIGLLAETAARMGFNLMAGSSASITYKPTVIIQGNATKKDIADAMAMDQERFNEMMDTYLKEKERESFAFEFAPAY